MQIEHIDSLAGVLIRKRVEENSAKSSFSYKAFLSFMNTFNDESDPAYVN